MWELEISWRDDSEVLILQTESIASVQGFQQLGMRLRASLSGQAAGIHLSKMSTRKKGGNLLTRRR